MLTEYLNAEKPYDARMESLEDRKKRLSNHHMLKLRSSRHAVCALRLHYLDLFLLIADSDNALLRQRSGICMARLTTAVDDEDLVKKHVQVFIEHTQSDDCSQYTRGVSSTVTLSTPLPVDVVAFLQQKNSDKPTDTAMSHQVIVTVEKGQVYLTCHPIEIMRRRALLESALLTCSNNELGVWSLKQPPLPPSEQDVPPPPTPTVDTTTLLPLPASVNNFKLPSTITSKPKDKDAHIKYSNNGVKQLLVLISSGDPRCQEVAAETMCLAAGSDSGSALLSVLVSSGALTSLLQSPSTSVRAAAASTMTKVSHHVVFCTISMYCHVFLSLTISLLLL